VRGQCQWRGSWRDRELRDGRAADVVGSYLPGWKHCPESVELLLVQSDGEGSEKAICAIARGAIRGEDEEEPMMPLQFMEAGFEVAWKRLGRGCAERSMLKLSISLISVTE
jgi:hypothetical protein